MKSQHRKTFSLGILALLSTASLAAKDLDTFHLPLRSQRPQVLISEIRADKAEIEAVLTDNEISDTAHKTPKFEIMMLQLAGGGVMGCLIGIGGWRVVGGSADPEGLAAGLVYGFVPGYVAGSAFGIWAVREIAGQKGFFGETLVGCIVGVIPGVYLAAKMGNLTPIIIFPLVGGVIGYSRSIP